MKPVDGRGENVDAGQQKLATVVAGANFFQSKGEIVKQLL